MGDINIHALTPSASTAGLRMSGSVTENADLNSLNQRGEVARNLLARLPRERA